MNNNSPTPWATNTNSVVPHTHAGQQQFAPQSSFQPPYQMPYHPHVVYETRAAVPIQRNRTRRSARGGQFERKMKEMSEIMNIFKRRNSSLINWQIYLVLFVTSLSAQSKEDDTVALELKLLQEKGELIRWQRMFVEWKTEILDLTVKFLESKQTAVHQQEQKPEHPNVIDVPKSDATAALMKEVLEERKSL